MSEPDPGPCWCGGPDLCSDRDCLRVESDHAYHFGHAFEPVAKGGAA